MSSHTISSSDLLPLMIAGSLAIVLISHLAVAIYKNIIPEEYRNSFAQDVANSHNREVQNKENPADERQYIPFDKEMAINYSACAIRNGVGYFGFALETIAFIILILVKRFFPNFPIINRLL